MRIRHPLPFGAAVAGVLAVSCSNPGFVCACLIPPPHAVVYGRVATAEGTGVGGAVVFAEAGDAACGSTTTLGHGVTRADGSYELTLPEPPRIRPGDCLRAYALAPGGPGSGGSDTVRFSVRFSAGAQLDSARVDLVYRAP